MIEDERVGEVDTEPALGGDDRLHPRGDFLDRAGAVDVVGDPLDPDKLESLGAKDAQAIVLALEDDSATGVATIRLDRPPMNAIVGFSKLIPLFRAPGSTLSRSPSSDVRKVTSGV